MLRKPTVVVALTLVLCWIGLPRTQQAQPLQQPPAQQPPQRPGIVRTVDLVNLVFTVTNRRGSFVTDLKRENFRVHEEGTEQQIQFFGAETDLPLRVGLLLDTSNSIRNRLQFEQEAAIDFLHLVVRRNKDLAFLMTFDSEHNVIEDYTDDIGALQEAILRQRAGGGTALYDAIYFACNSRLMGPPLPKGDNPEVRRVLVVISDGNDTMVSGHTLGDVVDVAQRAEVAIYAISTSTDWLAFAGSDRTRTPEKFSRTDGDKILEKLATETGGRAFFPYRVDDLAQSFHDIGDELRSQYSLAYVPTNRIADGKFRKVRIEVDRKGLIVRGRKGYFAPRPVAQPARALSNSPGN